MLQRFLRSTGLLACVLTCGPLWSQEVAGKTSIEATYQDVKYGPAERNVLDFYAVSSDRPTPLAIYIHGGGFVGGNKKLTQAQLEAFHSLGISVAAIH